MELFKNKKKQAIEANPDFTWVRGFAENIRIYIGKDSPLYEAASKFDFNGYMGMSQGDPRKMREAKSLVNQAISKVEINGTRGIDGIYERLSNLPNWEVLSSLATIISLVFGSGYLVGSCTSETHSQKAIIQSIEQNKLSIDSLNNSLSTFPTTSRFSDSLFQVFINRFDSLDVLVQSTALTTRPNGSTK